MIVLGINAYHADAAACLLRDGVLIAAAEEERFRRVKHWAGFPAQAILWCLHEAGLSLSEVSVVALNQDRRANLLRKTRYLIARRPDPALVLARLRTRRRRASVREELARSFPGEACTARVLEVEHHVAHLASAFLASPFTDAVAVSVDGFGDFASAAWGTASDEAIETDGRIYFPHSLGIFYEALTQYLGFRRYGDEYKVMGLAAYGEPHFMDEMRRLVLTKDGGGYALGLEYFRHHDEKVDYQWDGGEPVAGRLYSKALESLLGPSRREDEPLSQRHKNIACSVQAAYEEALFSLLNGLHERYNLDALCLAGGCAMNSVANGKIYARTPFKRVHVQPAAGDAGGAIGAAYVACQRAKTVRSGSPFRMTHAYWGPAYSDDEIGAALAPHADALTGENIACTRLESEPELIAHAARAIADGEVVGWFQGRMEWGARALGNRSILGDPRRADMKEILNDKIKRRESFRPFAPSILREAVAQWFEVDDDVPFMTQVYPIRSDRRAAIPAVTHVDGTGRLQTVTREANPLYYRLIEAFGSLTGVPLVLNTSFNENEPIVCRPQEALDCFLRTRMDLLVLGNWMLSRRARH